MANETRKPRTAVDPWLLLREDELATRWRVSKRTVQRRRAGGNGPEYILIGGTIRYRMADVLAFEARMRRGGSGS
jgi:hypothetical protein